MIGRATLVGRIAEVADMVGWVLFLASPEAGYLTGQTLSVQRWSPDGVALQRWRDSLGSLG